MQDIVKAYVELVSAVLETVDEDIMELAGRAANGEFLTRDEKERLFGLAKPQRIALVDAIMDRHSGE